MLLDGFLHTELWQSWWTICVFYNPRNRQILARTIILLQTAFVQKKRKNMVNAKLSWSILYDNEKCGVWYKISCQIIPQWCRKPEYPEKTTDLSQVTDKLCHIMLYHIQLAMNGGPLVLITTSLTDIQDKYWGIIWHEILYHTPHFSLSYNIDHDNLALTIFLCFGATVHGELYVIQHYMTKFVSDLWQVSGFLWILWFPPPIKLTATI
jgi:hypothetical protein